MKKTVSLSAMVTTFAIFAFGMFGALSLNGQAPTNPLSPDTNATARVQVIHNSADAAAAVVDIWLNQTKLIPNFAFRTASPFIDAPAGELLNIGVAPPNSTSWTQSLSIKQVVLTANQTYVIVANGIVSTSGYTPSPSFDLRVYPGAREAASQTGNTDILVSHGSTDAPAVDVKAGNNVVVSGLGYDDFQGYLEVPTADLVLGIAAAGSPSVLAQFSAPLASLGLQDSAITVVASGFLDPANNSNSTNTFGLWVALPSGGNLIPLQPYTPSAGTARLQVIHNSADAAAAVVDVWVDSTKLLPNFAFRTASPFVDAPAGVALNVVIAPANSTSPSQGIATFPVTLAENETYIVVANGIVSATGYSPSPAFNLDVYPMGREVASQTGNTDILVIHGSTDAPAVDVRAGNTVLISGIEYGDFDGYLEVPTSDLVLGIAAAGASTDLVQFNAPLATLGLQDSAITVVASGFLDPANNSNSTNTFGLWVALPAGGNLVPLSIFTNVREVYKSFKEVNVYPNPAKTRLNYSVNPVEDLKFRTQLVDVTGRIVHDEVNDGTGYHTGSIDVSSLNEGMYILRLNSEKEQHTSRVMIQR
jgi:hypothetical protein